MFLVKLFLHVASWKWHFKCSITGLETLDHALNRPCKFEALLASCGSVASGYHKVYQWWSLKYVTSFLHRHNTNKFCLFSLSLSAGASVKWTELLSAFSSPRHSAYHTVTSPYGEIIGDYGCDLMTPPWCSLICGLQSIPNLPGSDILHLLDWLLPDATVPGCSLFHHLQTW